MVNARPSPKAKAIPAIVCTREPGDKEAEFGVVFTPKVARDHHFQYAPGTSIESTSRAEPVTEPNNEDIIADADFSSWHDPSCKNPANLSTYKSPINYRHMLTYPDKDNWLEGFDVLFKEFERLNTFSFEEAPPTAKIVGT